MEKLNRHLGVILLLLLVWGASIRPALAFERLTYRLKWLPNMSTVGDLYADVYGLFKAKGLDVTVKSGGPERDAIRELELGQADFGVASADQVIRALAKGAPVVVVAQLFQRNPLQWIYYKNRVSLGTLGDLAGKRLGVTFGKNDEIIMRTLLSRAHISIEQAKLFSVRLDYTPFFKGVVDLWPVYINTQGVEIGSRLTAAGEQIGYFDPSHHGVQFVANSVVISERMLARKPEIVKRFMSALLSGWRQSLDRDNGLKAMAAVRQFDADTTEQVLYAQLAETRQLILPNPEIPIGTIDDTAWQQTEAIMLEHGQISKPVDVLRHVQPVLE